MGNKFNISDASDTFLDIHFLDAPNIHFLDAPMMPITADGLQFVKFEARNGGSMRPAPRMAEKIPLSELEKP